MSAKNHGVLTYDIDLDRNLCIFSHMHVSDLVDLFIAVDYFLYIFCVTFLVLFSRMKLCVALQMAVLVFWPKMLHITIVRSFICTALFLTHCFSWNRIKQTTKAYSNENAYSGIIKHW